MRPTWQLIAYSESVSLVYIYIYIYRPFAGPSQQQCENKKNNNNKIEQKSRHEISTFRQYQTSSHQYIGNCTYEHEHISNFRAAPVNSLSISNSSFFSPHFIKKIKRSKWFCWLVKWFCSWSVIIFCLFVRRVMNCFTSDYCLQGTTNMIL